MSSEQGLALVGLGQSIQQPQPMPAAPERAGGQLRICCVASPESGKIPWIMPRLHGNAPLVHSTGGLCTGAGKSKFKHTLDKEKHHVI